MSRARQAGAKTLHLNNTRVTETDSQKALLEYQDKISAAKSNMLVDTAYSKTQPKKILDFSEDVSEGDMRKGPGVLEIHWPYWPFLLPCSTIFNFFQVDLGLRIALGYLLEGYKSP